LGCPLRRGEFFGLASITAGRKPPRGDVLEAFALALSVVADRHGAVAAAPELFGPVVEPADLAGDGVHGSGPVFSAFWDGVTEKLRTVEMALSPG